MTGLNAMTKVEIDKHSGFCFGVVTAINKAEDALSKTRPLYCIGDIVHNNDEVERLRQKGLVTISHGDLEKLKDVTVLLRAHGEPPFTYRIAERNNIKILDATCPVVLRLQQRIKESYAKHGLSRQIVIYGKSGHAEVNGLVGQTDGKAIVVQGVDDLYKIDFSRDIDLYSQTTKSLSGFMEIISEIRKRICPGVSFESYDTICRQVANRVENLKKFAASHSLVLFVGGEKSSNGMFLFSECLNVNPMTKFVPNEEAINKDWLESIGSIGICGATSTPRWLMERVRDKVVSLLGSDDG